MLCITAHQQDHTFHSISKTNALMTNTDNELLPSQPNGKPKPKKKHSTIFYLRSTKINSTHVSPSESFARNWS